MTASTAAAGTRNTIAATVCIIVAKLYKETMANDDDDDCLIGCDRSGVRTPFK